MVERQRIIDVSAYLVGELDRDNDLSLSKRQELFDQLEQRIANEHKAAQHYWGVSLSCAKKVYFRWHSLHPAVDLRMWIQVFLASRGLEQSIEELAGLHKFLDVIWQSNPSSENGVAMAAAMTIYMQLDEMRQSVASGRRSSIPATRTSTSRSNTAMPPTMRRLRIPEASSLILNPIRNAVISSGPGI